MPRTDRWGHPLNRHVLRRRFQTACGVLGNERVRSLTLHHGRHTFVSHALAGGRTLAEVRAAAGQEWLIGLWPVLIASRRPYQRFALQTSVTPSFTVRGRIPEPIGPQGELLDGRQYATVPATATVIPQVPILGFASV
jgi:hypothetical protein